MFQSAPASVEAGDAKAATKDSSSCCFNPRPLPWKRATSIRAIITRWAPPFQSAPASVEAGDAVLPVLAQIPRRVSIRARFRGSGRLSNAP